MQATYQDRLMAHQTTIKPPDVPSSHDRDFQEKHRDASPERRFGIFASTRHEFE